MEQPRYILTVFNNDVLKEVNVSDDLRLLRIGTLQDCHVRLKRELFALPIGVTVSLEIDGWRISCDSDLYLNSQTTKQAREIPMRHGDIIQLHNAADDVELLTFSFAYDFTASAKQFDTIIDIRNSQSLVFGNSQKAQIKLNGKFIGSEYITLTRNNAGGLVLDASNAPNNATLNGIRISDKVELKECDFIGIADYSFYFKNNVLYTAMRNDLQITNIATHPLRDETPAFDYPKFNRNPRMRYAFNTDDIEILSPPKKPEKPKENLVLTLMPALLMITVVVVVRGGLIGGGMAGGSTLMIFSIAMMSVGIITSIMTLFHHRKRYKQDVEEWETDYKNYIKQKREEIEKEQRIELAALIDAYPSKEQIRSFVKTFSGRLFERSYKDDDFLHVRVGLGPMPALRKLSCKNDEKVKVENEFAHIPEEIRKEYEYIHGAPVMLHLRESGNVGVVGTVPEQHELFKNILIDICAQHHYDELQVVVLIPQDKQEQYDWLKWLPHIKESGGNVRGIVCDDRSRENVFEHLYALMAERATDHINNKRNIPIPHYVVFALEEYGIKTHPMYNFVEDCAAFGFSFIYFKEYIENLPQYCAEIINTTPNGGVLKVKNDKAFTCEFVSEQVKDDSIQFVAEHLTPVFCEKIALSSRLTANITLFELLNILTPEDLNLAKRWSESNAVKSLAAPLGVDVKGSQLMLDLHDNPKAHGPHGLVAGTTGAGKSEILQSYILSCATHFHPYEVSFVIIDFKGGGMANQFEDLPHLIGKITDIDDHEINRSLLSIRAELEKRKRLFAEFEVNHIDAYIEKYREGVTTTPLPHLILVVDEFAELKAEQPEFMKELVSTARVGRSLGIHLILATQKPSGQVSEQIWSNSKFKLCLKVANKEDSMEVLKSPLAAEIREPGRAYLQVGNNEIFTLFQSAYSGASAKSDKSGNIREFKISEVSFTGERTIVYERKAEQTSDGEKITQLKALVDYVGKHCKNADIPRLQSICLPPLPDCIEYEVSKNNAIAKPIVGVGLYDDPTNQQQPNYSIDLSEGNVMIIGSAQTGKTMLMQTILRGIVEKFSPKQTAIYILDFASKILKTYENEELNHIGGVVTDADDEKLKSFFRLMEHEIEHRKELFSQKGISSYEAYLETEDASNPSIPRIIIMLDNLMAFKDIHQDGYEDDFVYICREGLALGITVIATAKQTTGLSYKYFSNFATRIAFTCTEASEYSNIFDKCKIEPKDMQGRGLISVDKIVYECQTYLAFDGETESQRSDQIKEFIAKTKAKYGNERAKSIPAIPQTLTEDYWKQAGLEFNNYVVPVGLTYGDIEPVTIDLTRIGAVGIYGRQGFGKSNLLRIVMRYLQQNVFNLPCEAYLIDSYDRQMAEFDSFGFVQQLTLGCADFEDIVRNFADIAQKRMDTLRVGGSLDNEPLLLCVVQNSQIFAPNVVSKETSNQFKQLLNDAKQLKICFIFSNVDNNSEYSAPEMMKMAREFTQFFLLDDIAEVRLLGNKLNSVDMREYKKAIHIGDGYIYDARKGISKIKLVKSG